MRERDASLGVGPGELARPRRASLVKFDRCPRLAAGSRLVLTQSQHGALPLSEPVLPHPARAPFFSWPTARSSISAHLISKPISQRNNSHKGMVSKLAFLIPRHSPPVDVFSGSEVLTDWRLYPISNFPALLKSNQRWPEIRVTCFLGPFRMENTVTAHNEPPNRSKSVV